MRQKNLFFNCASIIGCCLFSSLSIASEKPILSLVIDDLGYSLSYGKQALALSGTHTYAIIPNSIHAKTLANMAHDSDKELIMHLPMQSSSHSVSHEKATLTSSMNEQKIIDLTQQFLDKMPHIKGINNHMGSHLTQFSYLMRPVMDTIYRHNPKLYFLDSRTSAKSTAYSVALRSGLKASKRNVFLDHSNSPSEIHYQFKTWLEKAKNNKSAVAIAHPIKSTLSVLAPLLEAEQDNYQFLPLSQYLLEFKQKTKETQTWPTYLSRLHKVAKTSKQ